MIALAQERTEKRKIMYVLPIGSLHRHSAFGLVLNNKFPELFHKSFQKNVGVGTAGVLAVHLPGSRFFREITHHKFAFEY